MTSTYFFLLEIPNFVAVFDRASSYGFSLSLFAGYDIYTMGIIKKRASTTMFLKNEVIKVLEEDIPFIYWEDRERFEILINPSNCKLLITVFLQSQGISLIVVCFYTTRKIQEDLNLAFELATLLYL